MDTPAEIFLPDEQATLGLGRVMAQTLPEDWPLAVVLLRGPLGSGKTTLTRGFVAALPGGDQAQVASPSFNLVNIYPSRPQVFHLDLFRLEPGSYQGDLEEILEPPLGEGQRVVLVEWAQNLSQALVPSNYLALDWREPGTGRELRLAAMGQHALKWLQLIETNIKING